MMNSWHVKSLDSLLSQYIESQKYDFSYDAGLRKVNPLIQRKLAYTTTQFSRPCSVFFEMAKNGTDAGFNTYVAWGDSTGDILDAVRERVGGDEVIVANQCVIMQTIWDPEYKDRSTYFGWLPIRTKRVSTKSWIRNKNAPVEPKTGEQEMAEVTPAFNRFVDNFEKYAIPFFDSLPVNIGKKWTDLIIFSEQNSAS
ncbi:hypothetical protein [Comamonas sp.]|uniref:hypothetical protein n=1 Tax=Comamonas sp. TaxID=34028 RepID=UPI0028986820|nr:hypothetical protein [Comamonas sp.]